MYYSHEFSHFQKSFSLHIKKKSNQDKCIRTSNLPDLMYAHIIKYCLVYFCVAFLRVLRIMTQNESCDKRQPYVVELAVGSEQKLYYFCFDFHLGPVLGPSCRRTSNSLTIKISRVYRTLYVSLI